MKPKYTNTDYIVAYLIAQDYIETEPERMGGVIYRAFHLRGLKPTQIYYKFFVAPTGRIREGITVITSSCVSADRAKLFLEGGREILLAPEKFSHDIKAGSKTLKATYTKVQGNTYKITDCLEKADYEEIERVMDKD